MKVLKNRIFLVIVTAIIFTGVGIYAESMVGAGQVSYVDSQTRQTTVQAALNDIYSRLYSYDPLTTNTIDLIGRNVGATVNVPAGYKYVVIFNGYYGCNGYVGESYKSASLLQSHTNSTVVINDWSVGADRYSTAAGYLVLAKIDDYTQPSTFVFPASNGFNITYGLK